MPENTDSIPLDLDISHGVAKVYKRRGFYFRGDPEKETEMLTTAEEAAFEEKGYDPKLKTLNSTGIDRRITEAASRRELVSNETWGVIFLDFNKFKALNDILGQSAGDEYLIEIAKVLNRSVRSDSDDWAARIGGEEFLIVARFPDSATAILVMETQRASRNNGNRPSIIQGIADGIEQVRKEFASKYPDFNNSSVVTEIDSNLLPMYEKGVATVSMGVQYFSSKQIKDAYTNWQNKVTKGSFTNEALLPKLDRLVKNTAKRKSRDSKNTVAYAIVDKNNTRQIEITASTTPTQPTQAE